MYAPPGFVGTRGEISFYLKIDPRTATIEELRGEDRAFELGVPRSNWLLEQVMVGLAASCVVSEVYGKIYSPPAFGNDQPLYALALDPRDETVHRNDIQPGDVGSGEFISRGDVVAWANAAYNSLHQAPNGKLYSPPYSVIGGEVLVIDPATDTATLIDAIAERFALGAPVNSHLQDFRLYYACTFAPQAPHMLCCPSDEATKVLVIDTATDTFSQDAIESANFTSNSWPGSPGNFESAVASPDGRIYAHPDFNDAAVVIDPDAATADLLGPWVSAQDDGAQTGDCKYVPTTCRSNADSRRDSTCSTTQPMRRGLRFGYTNEDGVCELANHVDGWEACRAKISFGLVDWV
mmetsp:Transcript_1388/g.5368  ORF Transcript_1388/g.5368 Transcript_1388/m.5368 type:complete len:350 (-) Transcript_1388:605-1654(-)